MIASRSLHDTIILSKAEKIRNMKCDPSQMIEV